MPRPISTAPLPPRAADGARAEALAADFLTRHGLIIVERNWRRRHGEIDVIARDGEMLVFIEVRLRRRSDFGGAAASITAAKQSRLLRAAALYLARFANAPPCRFDAILLDALDAARIEWLRDVFGS
jgi:putative endonuclease